MAATAAGVAAVAAVFALLPSAGAEPAPQTPQFLSTCAFSHRAPNDPIVHAGMPGMSHMHDFFGNGSTNAYSTLTSLRRGRTNCHPRGDLSGYWVPTLYVRGRAVRESSVTAYYEASADRAAGVKPFPPGLRIVAGNSMAKRPENDGVAVWSCAGTAISSEAAVPVCPSWSRVELEVEFPDCWDGRHLDSANHKRHMAYSRGGVCPASRPVRTPRLRLYVIYATSGGRPGVVASGPGYTAHGDFFNAWDPRLLRRRIDRCLHGAMRCNFDGQPY